MNAKEVKSLLRVNWQVMADACDLSLPAVKKWDKIPKWHRKTIIALAKQRGVNITLEELA